MDKYLVSLAFILLSLECGWLLQDLKIIKISSLGISSEADPHSSALGQITYTKKDVRRKPNSSLVWEETEKTQNLYAYDSILTMDQSAAELNFSGNSKITLHENTLVSIEPFEKNGSGEKPVRLRFKSGTLKASAGRTPQSIDTGDMLIQAEANAKITIRSRGPGEYFVEASEGAAKVIDARTHEVKETIEKGQILQINSEKLSALVDALKTDWKFPKDGERIYTHELSEEVDFDWVGRATVLDLFEAKSNGVQSVPILTPSHVKVRLLLGNYVAKLQDRDQNSFARNLSIWKAPKIYLVKPLFSERFKVQSVLTLEWMLNSDVTKYFWEIASDSEFKNILRQGETTESSAEIKDLPLGEFFWRVRGADNLEFAIPEFYKSSFSILKNPLAPPKLKKAIIRDESSFQWWNLFFSTANASEDVVPLMKNYAAEFQWEEVAGADGYIIEVSDTSSFRKLVLSTNSKLATFKWKNFPLGQYYWRVAAVDDEGNKGLFSEVGFAELRKIPTSPIKSLAKPAPFLSRQESVVPAPRVTAPTAMGKVIEVSKEEIELLARIPKPSSPEWTVELFGGLNFDFENDFAKDFKAQIKGFGVGNFRFRLTSPVNSNPHENIFHLEGEFQKSILKSTDSNSFPFQDILSSYQFRISYLQESAFQNEIGYGITIQNEATFFTRADFENLSARNPLLIGGLLSWQKIKVESETSSRVGLFVGEAFVIEHRLNQIFYFRWSKDFSLSLTPELDLTLGVAKDSNYWFDAKGLLLFGARW